MLVTVPACENACNDGYWTLGGLDLFSRQTYRPAFQPDGDER